MQIRSFFSFFDDLNLAIVHGIRLSRIRVTIYYPVEQGLVCPDTIAFARPTCETPPYDFLDNTTWVVDDAGWHIRANYAVLFAYFQFACRTGLYPGELPLDPWDVPCLEACS